MGGSTPYGINETGAQLAIRLTPKAGQAGIRGIAQNAAGDAYIKAGVTAPTEGSKANKALLKLLARELGLPASTMSIASGGQARQKSIQIAGDPARIKKCLELFCGDLS